MENPTSISASASPSQRAKGLFWCIILVSLDYVTKAMAMVLLSTPYQINSWFRFQLEKNTGIAFSIAIPQLLLIPLNILIFTLLLVFLIRKTDTTKPLTLSIITFLTAGAFGNLLDRLNQGYVTDFISVWNFPVFNLADAYITVSVFLLLLFYDRIRRPN